MSVMLIQIPIHAGVLRNLVRLDVGLEDAPVLVLGQRELALRVHVVSQLFGQLRLFLGYRCLQSVHSDIRLLQADLCSQFSLAAHFCFLISF